MSTNRYFKIPKTPRSVEVLIILFVLFAPIGYLLFVAWGQLYVRTIPFKDVQEMNKYIGMDLRGTYNQFGFIRGAKNRGPTVYWAMLGMDESNLEAFKKNNWLLEEKLICDENSMMIAEVMKMIDPKTKKRNMRELIPDGFVPKYGFTETVSDVYYMVLVGTYEHKFYVYVQKIK
jgi:hypothetical protein